MSTMWWGWVLRSESGITHAGAGMRLPTAFFFGSHMACHLPSALLVAAMSTSFARSLSAPTVLWRLPAPTSCGGTTWSGTRVRGVLLFSAHGVPCSWCHVLLFQSNAWHVWRLQFASQPTASACSPPLRSPHAAVGPLSRPPPAAGHLVYPARRPCSSSRGTPPTPAPAGGCSGVVYTVSALGSACLGIVVHQLTWHHRCHLQGPQDVRVLDGPESAAAAAAAAGEWPSEYAHETDGGLRIIDDAEFPSAAAAYTGGGPGGPGGSLSAGGWSGRQRAAPRQRGGDDFPSLAATAGPEGGGGSREAAPRPPPLVKKSAKCPCGRWVVISGC